MHTFSVRECWARLRFAGSSMVVKEFCNPIDQIIFPIYPIHLFTSQFLTLLVKYFRKFWRNAVQRWKPNVRMQRANLSLNCRKFVKSSAKRRRNLMEWFWHCAIPVNRILTFSARLSNWNRLGYCVYFITISSLFMSMVTFVSRLALGNIHQNISHRASLDSNPIRNSILITL